MGCMDNNVTPKQRVARHAGSLTWIKLARAGIAEIRRKYR